MRSMACLLVAQSMRRLARRGAACRDVAQGRYETASRTLGAKKSGKRRAVIASGRQRDEGESGHFGMPPRLPLPTPSMSHAANHLALASVTDADGSLLLTPQQALALLRECFVLFRQ